jgi:DNA-binding LytR/AlgR family response regulator
MMQPIKKRLILVEDELIIARSLKKNLEEFDYQIIGPAIDYEEALQLVKNNAADLVLIDIRLNGSKTGIDLAHYLKANFPQLPFIYLTSFTDPKTIELAKHTNPAAYLIKPFDTKSLYCTIEVVLHNQLSAKKELTHIVLSLGNRSEKVNVNEILYLEAEHVYVNVVTASKKLVVRSSLTKLLEELPSDVFFKSHRSFAVNIKYIQSVTNTSIYLSNFEVPLSRSCKAYLLSILKR